MPIETATAAVIKAAHSEITCGADIAYAVAVAIPATGSFSNYCVRTNQTTTWCVPVGFNAQVTRKIPVGATV